MQLSKYNITSKIKDSDDWFVVNALSGQADILDQSSFNQLNNCSEDNPELIENGYIVDPVQEKKLFREKYLKFLDDREKDEVQIFFVTNYSCNFDCSYCYQAGYEALPVALSKEVTDSFFDYILKEFSGRRKYITIFGGEPFMNAPRHKENIEYIIQKAAEHNLEIAAVTNGYHLEEFISILKKGIIREIQVTLDGTIEIHNQRRYLKGGDPTFDRIVRGVDLLIENNIPVNLRMVVDKQNINNLPDLAQFAIDKGWTASPLFKTQLGRNYELHECQANQKKLYSRLELYQDLYNLLKEFPHISEFHKPAFSVSKFLFEQGEMPAPLFDACTGTKTEWAFDFTGNVYACTATVGKHGESLGTFYPEVRKNTEAVEEWQERDILSIPKCQGCNLSLICGGGCASMAKNYNGSLNSHDCRPVTELLELGIGHYFNNLTMDCTNCTYDKQCRSAEACKATSFDRDEVIQKYAEESVIVQAAAELVDFGRAGTLSRLQETIAFAKKMEYKRIGLAYCYGMEKQVTQLAAIIRNNGLNVRAVSCTVSGIPQNLVNPESDFCTVSCNPIGQARQLNNENVDLVVMIGLCLGHDILFQREVKADCTTLVVKDRVHNHAPLMDLSENQKNK